MKRSMIMHAIDMVATALHTIYIGDEVGVYNTENSLLFTIIANENIPFGNKIALMDIGNEQVIMKYAHPIGIATQAIDKGCLVHVHNVKSLSVDVPPACKVEIMRQMNIEQEGV